MKRSLMPLLSISTQNKVIQNHNKYLKFSPQEYQSQMLVNLRETYPSSITFPR